MNNHGSVGSHTHTAIFNISPNKVRERDGGREEGHGGRETETEREGYRG